MAEPKRDVEAISTQRVAFIMYPVSDMARAVRFYSDVLGLTKAGLDNEHWVEFDVSGTTFGVGDFEEVGTPGTAQSLALEVADMTVTRTALSDRGLETTEPFETPMCFLSMLRDPDGNQIWLHQLK